MSWMDIAYEMIQGVGSRGGSSLKYQVYESQIGDTNGSGSKEIEPKNMITIFTASKILSSTISALPVSLVEKGKEYNDNVDLSYKLKYRMSSDYNNQTFWNVIEYLRSVYGNAYVSIKRNMEIIHPTLITEYDYNGVNGSLRYYVEWSRQSDNPKYKGRSGDWIESADMLHFKGMSTNGVFGLSPVEAAAQSMQVLDKATNTIVNFYDNKAMSPMAIESIAATAASSKGTIEALDTFVRRYTGTANAGKPIQLSPNTKLSNMAIQFADAELINTMKFTRDEIMALYGVPQFMYASSNEAQADIEQQTLRFKTFTIAPIIRIYEEELDYKLLTKEERVSGVTTKFNLDAMLEADLTTKASSYGALAKAGIITLNEASEKMGFSRTDNSNMDKHYLQVQNFPVEEFEYVPNPTLKGVNPQTEKINE